MCGRQKAHIACGYRLVTFGNSILSEEKTTFSVGDGLCQWSVMPFGFRNAPATFERLVDQVLKGLHWKTCLMYLEDIIVNVEEVFQRIVSAGLKLSRSKWLIRTTTN